MLINYVNVDLLAVNADISSVKHPSNDEQGEVAALIGYLTNAMMLIYINAYHSG